MVRLTCELECIQQDDISDSVMMRAEMERREGRKGLSVCLSCVPLVEFVRRVVFVRFVYELMMSPRRDECLLG